jgi:PAS domain S-box-containing protein
VIEANPAFCRMHGYTHDEIVGADPTAFIHPDDHGIFVAYIAAVAEGRDYLTRARDVRKDGTVFDVEVHGTAFRFLGGDHVLGVVRDITLEVQAKVAAREERQRIARDLHDSVSQTLFSLSLHARRAQMALPEGDGDLADAVAHVTALSRTALAEMRTLIYQLRPAALTDAGLGAAIVNHAAALSVREDLRIDVRVPDERLPLDPDQEDELYHLVLEAVHNAVKHAGASLLAVVVATDEDAVDVTVEDDGAGFVVDEVPTGGLGLHTMRERARALGGSLQVSSTVGTGTTVAVRIEAGATGSDGRPLEPRARPSSAVTRRDG